MKKQIYLMLCIACITLCSCSQRIGDLTMISNRNVEFDKKHVELKRDVYGKSQTASVLGIRFKSTSLEEAIDDCIKKQGSGEYLTNATIEYYYKWCVVFSLSGYRVKGDLMGYENQAKK